MRKKAILLLRPDWPHRGRRLIHARIVDVSRRILATQLREGQDEVLELIAREAPLKEILDRLLLAIKRQSPGVHNIVGNILGGRIELRSAPGEGATFTLLLPSVAPQRPAFAPLPRAA